MQDNKTAVDLAEGNKEIMTILREIDSSTESGLISADDGHEKEYIAIQQTKKESVSIPWIKSDLVRPCTRLCTILC